MRSALGFLLAWVFVSLAFVTGCGLELTTVGGGGPDGGHGGGSSGSSGGSGGGVSVGGGSGGGTSSGGGSGAGTGDGNEGGSAAHKRVLVTSSTFSGDLGGAEGADAKCENAAEAAALGGAWKAWISTSNVNAIDRIADVGPWYLVDRATRVFNDKANLLTTPLFPIMLDENGRLWQGSGLYGTWSGSDDQGVVDASPYDDACSDWSSASPNDQATAGSPDSATQEWGGGGPPLPCDGANSLICFEQ